MARQRMAASEIVTEALAIDETQLRRAEADLATIRAGGKVEHLTLENAEENVEMIRACIESARAYLVKLTAQAATDFETDCPEPYENDLEERGRIEADEDAAAGEFDDEREVDPEVLDASDVDIEPAGQRESVMEAMIVKAAQMLCLGATEAEVHATLIESGATSEEAHFAVIAGRLLG